MLPSVGAGSAALTTYAQTAVAASGHPARDPELPARTDQEAARNPGEPAAARIADDTLARKAGETVAALLEILHDRVRTALASVGVPEALAEDAARQAVARLAEAIASHGEHAAKIVQAVLDNLASGNAPSDDALLHLAARGLTVAIDRLTGAVEVSAPDIDIRPATQPGTARPAPASVHHLLDVTDGDTANAAPLLAALDAVHAAVSGAADGRFVPAGGLAPAAALAIAPEALAAALAPRIAPHLDGTDAAARQAASTVSRVIAAAMATPTDTRTVPLDRVVAAAGALEAAPGDALAGDGRVVLASKDLSVALQPRDGSVTVRLGARVVAFAPASLPPATAGAAPPPGIEAASLPIRDISPSIPAGTVLDEPTGVPFVPPEISDMPPPDPRKPADAPPRAPSGPAANADAVETARLQATASRANLTVLRAIEVHAAADGSAAITRVAFDLSAAIAAGPTAAARPEAHGRLGRSEAAPAQSEKGPVLENGYTDATASRLPVLPAWVAGAFLPEPDRREPERRKPARPPQRTHAEESEPADDTFSREVPAGYQGPVQSSVGFSV